MRSVMGWVGVGLIGLFFAALPFGDAGEKKPLRVCLVSGSAEYESDKSLAILQEYFAKNHPHVTCTRAFAVSENDLPGLENLEKCDVAVLFTRRLKLAGKQLERFKAYCTSGKPIVGIRTASHGVQSWLDFDKEILGGNYKGHFQEGVLTDIALSENDKDFHVLAGFLPFKSAGSLYKNTGVAKDVQVVLTGSIPGHTEPIAWLREVNGGRVFYTSLGHQKDFREPAFLRLVSNAVHWTAKRDGK
jgi:type 1 glutamine amidotransferase